MDIYICPTIFFLHHNLISEKHKQKRETNLSQFLFFIDFLKTFQLEIQPTRKSKSSRFSQVCCTKIIGIGHIAGIGDISHP